MGLTFDDAYLADFLHSLSGPIVLVGHSYGGAVITNAATGDKQVKALAYVDAFMPAKGESVGQLVAAESQDRAWWREGPDHDLQPRAPGSRRADGSGRRLPEAERVP